MIAALILRNPLHAGLGAALALASLTAGVQTWRLHSERTAHAETRTQWAEQRAAGERAAREASEAHRATEQRWAEQRARSEADHARTRKERDRIRLDLVDTGERLRDAARAFAAGGDPAAADALAAAHRRAATLADVFSEADRVAGEMAQAADRHASEVKLLLDAWPR